MTEVCSVSSCVNDDVVDLQKVWRHNRYGVASNPSLLSSMALEIGTDVRGATLFYYEVYEEELESDGWTFEPANWRPLSPLPSVSADTEVLRPPPLGAKLIGYDVVVSNDFLEHSPLSCNGVAAHVPVNQSCLFDTFQAAKDAIDAGAFGGGCEDGIYRIFSVSIAAPAGPDGEVR